MDYQNVMFCKAVKLADVIADANKQVTAKDIKDIVEDEQFGVQDVTITKWDDMQSFDFGMQQYWMVTLEDEDVKLFVDTQGYDYPRYVSVAVNK